MIQCTLVWGRLFSLDDVVVKHLSERHLPLVSVLLLHFVSAFHHVVSTELHVSGNNAFRCSYRTSDALRTRWQAGGQGYPFHRPASVCGRHVMEGTMLRGLCCSRLYIPHHASSSRAYCVRRPCLPHRTKIASSFFRGYTIIRLTSEKTGKKKVAKFTRFSCVRRATLHRAIALASVACCCCWCCSCCRFAVSAFAQQPGVPSMPSPAFPCLMLLCVVRLPAT